MMQMEHLLVMKLILTAISLVMRWSWCRITKMYILMILKEIF